MNGHIAWGPEKGWADAIFIGWRAILKIRLIAPEAIIFACKVYIVFDNKRPKPREIVDAVAIDSFF